MLPLRHAVRALWTRPQLSLVAVALLALGIGANTTLFALSDAVMFRPFAFADQDRLIIGGGVQAGQRTEIAYPDFVDWRTRARSFDDLAAMGSSNWTATLHLDEPLPVEYRAVSGNFFDVLGARAALGRALKPSDDRRGVAPVVVLSHGFWQRQFGGDPRVIGRSVRFGRRPYTIVGVMPPAFTYPGRPDVWVAIVPAIERFPVPGEPDFVDNRDVSVLLVVGRLKAGVSIEAARIGRRSNRAGACGDVRTDEPHGGDGGAACRRCDRLGADSSVGPARGGGAPADRRRRERRRPVAGADVGATA